MPSLLLTNADAVVGDELVRSVPISIEKGRIASIGDSSAGAEMIDCSGLILLPGFIDIHIHGAVGIDVNTAETDGLLEIAKFLATKGVTSWVPTLVPDSDESYARAIASIDRLMDVQVNEPVAQAVGVHYEGVYANEKMCGALRPEYFKKYPTNQLSELPKLDHGIHMKTFAPEVEGGIGLAKELKRLGWIASIGHTSANVETLNSAFEAGAHHITHFFNAMTGLHHRDVGVVGWALTNPEVTFDIIADGIHVDPGMLEFAIRTKTPDRVTLISDSVAPTGLGDGEFEIWGEKVTVEKGRTQNERGGIAGSVITMLDAANEMLSIGFTSVDVSRMASRNPARLIGIETDRGSIDIGKRADIVGLDKDGKVRLTVTAGRIAFDER